MGSRTRWYTVRNVLSRLALVSLLTAACFGQGGNLIRQVVSGTVANGGSGQVIPNAIVRVCTSTAIGTPCSPLISNVYADPGLTSPLGNPFDADSNGFYSVFLPTGSFLVQESTPIGAGFVYSESFLVFVNGTGTVSIVNLSLPGSVFAVTGSGCTGVCNLSASFVAQNANTVFGNCLNSIAFPSFCSLTANMIPSTLNSTTINGLTVNGNETVSGTLGVTGASSFTGNVTLSGTLAAAGSITSSATLFGLEATIGVGGIATTGFLTASQSITSSTSLVAGTFVNAATGYQIGGSYGTSGYCLQSTGTGTAFRPGCSIGGTPSVVAGAALGSGSASLVSGSTDKIGAVNATAASGTTSSIFALTFSTPFSTFASCTFAPAGGSAASADNSLSIYMPVSASGFSLVLGTGALINTSYQWSYLCNGY